MSSTASQPQGKGFIERLRKKKRRAVKQAGKYAIRRLAGFLASQSLVGNKPVYTVDEFPFIRPLEENWEIINKELQGVLKHREHVPAFQQISPDQKRITEGDRWKTFILYGFGQPSKTNCAACPETAQLLSRIPNLQIAWFSIIGPGYHVPAHCGVTKGILRSHLGLVIPKEREKCRIRIGDEIRVWEQGKAFVFDDTYEHEVWNDTDEERVVLLFDFDRPMKFWGRALNNTFLFLLKFTAYYRDPKRNVHDWEKRFEEATRKANETLEQMSEPR